MNISSYLGGFSGYSNKSGINTNTPQYKAAERDFGADLDAEIAAMTEEQRLIFEFFGGREAHLRNVSLQYDSNGDFVGAWGVSGMLVNGIPESERNQLINISEEHRQNMFDLVKKEFIREMGVANGDTTKRSDVFKAYQLSVKKEDRLKGTYTLEQYERQYELALVAAVRAVNPNWKPGDYFDRHILDSITRESVENTLVQSGNTFVRKGVDYSV